MKANPTAETDSPSVASENKMARRRKPAARKSAAAKPTRKTAASRRSSAGRATKASRQSSGRQGANGYSATALRLMSQGREALSGAYEWAADGATRAGRALPRAASHLPDQRTLQNLIEDRPLVLGAIGLGLGAMIGMMLPSRLMMGGTSPPRRPARRSGRKS